MFKISHVVRIPSLNAHFTAISTPLARSGTNVNCCVSDQSGCLIPRPAGLRRTASLRTAGLRTAGLHTVSLRTSDLRTTGLRTASLCTAGRRTADLRTAGLRTAGLHTHHTLASKVHLVIILFFYFIFFLHMGWVKKGRQKSLFSPVDFLCCWKNPS